MNKKMMIWDREFELNIVLECYPGETVLDTQKDALLWLDDGEMIASVLDVVKEYVEKTTTTEIDLPIKNIFKYVVPKSVFIPHSKNTAKLAIMCNYKFDMEHGIAIVFEKGKFKEVGPQDIIL